MKKRKREDKEKDEIREKKLVVEKVAMKYDKQKTKQTIILISENLNTHQFTRSIKIFPMSNLCLKILTENAESLTHGCCVIRWAIGRIREKNRKIEKIDKRKSERKE